MRKLAAVITFLFLLSGCIKINLYEKQEAIPDQEWYYNNVLNYSFDIKDTTSRFYIYIVLRHTDQYQYNNIWLKVGTAAPGEKMEYQKINLQLAGKDAWEGVGMDDIYEVRKMISPGALSFRKPGTYTFSIAQIMRDNPLKYVLNAGIRIEKAE